MPYRRKYGRRKYRRNRTSWYNKKYSVSQIARKAWGTAKYLKRVLNVEKKKHDVNLALTTNNSVVALNHIPQGDTDQTRDGNSLKQQSLSIKGYIQGSSTLDSLHARVIVFFDKQQVPDANPTITDLLDPSSSNAVFAPLNNETVGRYKILSDKRYSLNNAISGNAVTHNYSFSTALKSHARFNGPASSDIQKNGLYIGIVHDGGITPPTLAATSRVTYTDN